MMVIVTSSIREGWLGWERGLSWFLVRDEASQFTAKTARLSRILSLIFLFFLHC